MLDKSKRLNLKKSFKFASQGQKVFTHSFTLMYRSGENTQPLIGIALSRRRFKSAASRNRAKRLASRAAALIYPALRNNLNLVIIPKAGVLNSHPDDLAQELHDVQALYSTD